MHYLTLITAEIPALAEDEQKNKAIAGLIIHNGQVYKRHAGPLNHQKKTKSAKRIKAIPNYPIKKLYPSFSDYATEYWGFYYDPEHEAYGFYYNPNAFYDWYSIGGRRPDLFLVKEGCKECSAGERSFFHYGTEIPCSEGYKWACAARKKDIEWQAMAGWRLSCAKKQFHSLEKLFLTGEREDGIHRIITDKGILYGKKLIYEKNETEEQYLSRLNFSHYPVNFYGLLSGKEWITKDSFPIAGESSDHSRNTWEILRNMVLICKAAFSLRNHN